MATASSFVEISKEFFGNLLDNSISEKIKRETKYGMKICDSYVNLCTFRQSSAMLSFGLFPINISST